MRRGFWVWSVRRVTQHSFNLHIYFIFHMCRSQHQTVTTSMVFENILCEFQNHLYSFVRQLNEARGRESIFLNKGLDDDECLSVKELYKLECTWSSSGVTKCSQCMHILYIYLWFSTKHNKTYRCGVMRYILQSDKKMRSLPLHYSTRSQGGWISPVCTRHFRLQEEGEELSLKYTWKPILFH